MKTVLAAIAAIGMMTSTALACGMDKTAGHHSMSVASLDDQTAPMSTEDDAEVDEDIRTGSIESADSEEAAE